jgi:DNA mismatch repair protein MutS2
MTQSFLSDAQTLRALEFDKVKVYLENFVTSELGRSWIQVLEPSSDKEVIETRLTETSEVKEIRSLHGPLPLEGLEDIRESLYKVKVEGSLLTPAELLGICRVLEVGNRTKRFVTRLTTPYPHLLKKVEQIHVLENLEQVIRRAINDQGEILDSASLKLKKIRQDLRLTRDRIQNSLKDLFKRSDLQKIIQEPIITIRNNRYVIPVKTGFQSKLRGIIQDQSMSGATVFLEPIEVVELNNRLITLDAEEREEIHKILLELSAKVREHLDAIQITTDILGEIDFIQAKARLSEKWKGTQPRICEDKCISLIQARHPLLLIQHEGEEHKVIPIDVRIENEINMLLITGPNTGGKTVSLKTIGLLILMTQAGLHIPANIHSELPLFQKVFADIGDLQSIEQSLSTFSSHISRIVHILNHADARTLVLLDELGAGTDPAEGAALGIAILEYLDQIGAKVVVTSHHDSLKTFAYTHPRALNASVEFDINTLSPTYRLLFGLPGKSNAFIIASRLGLPENIVQRARSLMGSEFIRLEKLIQKLTTDSEFIEKAREEAEQSYALAKQAQEKWLTTVQTLEQERQDILNRATTEAKEIVDAARRKAKYILTQMQTVEERQAVKLLETLKQDSQKLKNRIQPSSKVLQNISQSGELHIGQFVQIPSLNQKGTILGLNKDKKTAEVQVGSVKLQVSTSQLVPLSKPISPQVEEIQPTLGIEPVKDEIVRGEITLAGKPVATALEELDKFLDEAVLAGLSSVAVIHGIGTGKLKAAVEKMLSTHPQVAAYNTAEHYGGITLVKLK